MYAEPLRDLINTESVGLLCASRDSDLPFVPSVSRRELQAEGQVLQVQRTQTRGVYSRIDPDWKPHPNLFRFWKLS
jgi:hypothetical protein